MRNSLLNYFVAFCACLSLPQSSRSQETVRYHRRTERSTEIQWSLFMCTPGRCLLQRWTSRTSPQAISDWPRRWPRRCQSRTCGIILSSQWHTICGWPCASAPPFQNPRQTDSPAMCHMYWGSMKGILVLSLVNLIVLTYFISKFRNISLLFLMNV